MKSLLLVSLSWMLLASAADGEEDAYERIRRDLTEAECAHFQFLSMIESEVFESVDSAFGSACLARDGRYRITLGSDEYLFDGATLYSYSKENNQVTLEKMSAGQGGDEAIGFILHLEKHFTHQPVNPGLEYLLVRRSGDDSDIPDSMHLFIDRNNLKLDQVEYFDINEELNRLLFIDQELSGICDSSLFVPDFPDSVETVKLW